MDISVSTVATALLASLVVATLCYLASGQAPRHPPGPKGWPLIGNLLDAPKPGSEWVDYHEMCKKHNSDVLYLRILGQSILVLDSIEAVTELFEKRSDIYSSRPRFVMISELMDLNWHFAFSSYGSFWRTHRRLFHSEFNIRAVSLHHPQQTHGAHGLLERLLERPDQWRKHIRHQIGATILDIAYGIKALPEDDPLIELAEKAVDSYMSPATIPGRFLVDTVPMLKHVPEWVPGASFQQVAREGKVVFRDTNEVPFDQVKRAMANGTADPSFSLNCLQRIGLSGEKDEEAVIKNCASTMFAAGSDTTVSSLSTFILAMIKHPEVQAKAQLELDSVLGSGELPAFGDEASLPYITAIVKECLRWEVVLPIAIPHMSTTDDEYKGYHIPAGTLVIPNSWAILNDDRMYPDPFTFNPDRFMKDGKLDPSVRDPDAAFGYGRRICPGQHMAQDTLWINTACILACFNIEKPLDALGNAFEPSVKYTAQLLRHPEAFECRIKPRSQHVEDMIRGLSA